MNVKFAQILTFSENLVRVNKPETERYITVLLYGRGVVERKIKEGKIPVAFTGYKARAGQLIISTINARNGAAGIIPPELDGAVVSKDFPLFNIDHSLVDEKYLLYYLWSESFIHKAEQSSYGATMPRLHVKPFLGMQMFLPSLTEQKSRAKIIGYIEHLLYLQNRQLDKLDELVKSRFIEMFGDPLGSSKEWPCVSVSNVCRSILGGGTPAKGQQEYFTGTIPWVTPKDMKSSTISDSIDHITEEAIAHSSTNLVPENSVLMVIRSGILKHTLPVAINRVPVTINQDMKAFVPNEIIKATFMMYFFKMIEQDVLSGVRSVTADNIDFKAFSKRVIIVPPLELQQQFAAFVEQTDKSKFRMQKSLELERNLWTAFQADGIINMDYSMQRSR